MADSRRVTQELIDGTRELPDEDLNVGRDPGLAALRDAGLLSAMLGAAAQ